MAPSTGAFKGAAVAAFRIESHFDIRREYNTVTGEEFNVIVENTSDQHWYDRQFMRVDWSQNLLTSYFANSHNLSELFGRVRRESTDLFVQDASNFPAEWRPQFHFMSCDGAADENCNANDRDWAADYEQDTLYSMSFVTQEVLSPGTINIPFFGAVKTPYRAPPASCCSFFFGAFRIALSRLPCLRSISTNCFMVACMLSLVGSAV